MKKLISVILSIVMIASIVPSMVFADNSISITIDGKAQIYDVMPVIENGRTLVPMRAIFEALGADIYWNDAKKTVLGKKDDTEVTLQIGNTNAKVNNKDVTLDVAATIIEGRTMVPVRFISEALGCTVNWDDTTKTVIITGKPAKPAMAELVSTVHRNVPTEFEKSNDLNDIIHFEGMTPEQQETTYLNVKSQGEVVCTEDKFLESITYGKEEYGKAEVIDVDGQPFKKALRITCTTVPEKTANFIVRTKATPERTPGAGVDKNDVMLLAFRMRTISTDAADGLGKVQVQIEHPESFKKALFNYATAGKDWTVIYLGFKGVQDATSIGIRGGFAKQVVELGGIEITNLGPGFDLSKLPTASEFPASLQPDAQWRKDANKRIEKIRKGDFSVIVKDKDGNVIPNAEVEFDMFEHEFQFGNSVTKSIHENPTYAEKHGELFNAAVLEHFLKWQAYEGNKEESRREVEAAKAAGVKYLRGHSLFWEKMKGSGNWYLTPPDLETISTKDAYLARCEEHVKEICEDFYEDFIEWDVINEIDSDKMFADKFGDDTWKSQFEMARKYSKEGTDLYYNDNTQHLAGTTYFDTLEKVIATGADFDGIGFQSHYDRNVPDVEEIIALYEKMENYGDKKLKVTEFTNAITDMAYQGNFTRDIMIASFAEDDMTGFILWNFWDSSVDDSFRTIYDNNWNLKPAGEQFIDLVYNKWWTKDAKAVTDAQGKATVRGFYGDYDITVNANGKTKTVMAAYHKGYDNVLEITIE